MFAFVDGLRQEGKQGLTFGMSVIAKLYIK